MAEEVDLFEAVVAGASRVADIVALIRMAEEVDLFEAVVAGDASRVADIVALISDRQTAGSVLRPLRWDLALR